MVNCWFGFRFHSFCDSVSRSWVRSWSGQQSNVPNTGAWHPFCGDNLTCTCHLLASLSWDCGGNHCRISSLHSDLRDAHLYVSPGIFIASGQVFWRFFGCNFESTIFSSRRFGNFVGEAKIRILEVEGMGMKG